MIHVENFRKPEFPIEPLILRRWSPRAMSGEGISEKEMLTLFEAARWAPSTNNEQEWRFVYARRDTDAWGTLFDLLAEGNRIWCDRAALLCVICAHTVFSRNGKPNPVHGCHACVLLFRPAEGAYTNDCTIGATDGLVCR